MRITRSGVTVAATIAWVAGTLLTEAATNYWDNNGTAAGFGAAGGTWGIEQKWSADSAGVAAAGTIATTTSDDLHLGTAANGLTAGMVSVDGVAQGFRSLSFGAASGQITVSGGTLNLAATVSSVLANNASNTIASILAGNGALHLPGTRHHASFLTASAVTIFPNMSLADYHGAYGIMGGASIGVGGGGAIPCKAYFFSNDGSTATFQLQQVQDTPWTKCVKVELTQVGADIAARAVYAKYIANGGVLGYDFDAGGDVNAIATSYAAGGYGAAEMTLTTYGTHPFFLTATAAPILTNAALSECLGVDGILGGAYIQGGADAGDAYYFVNDGSTATYQLQADNGGYTKCVKVELTQVGADILARAVYARYTATGNLGFDFDSGANNGTIATSYGAAGYGVAETTLDFVNDNSVVTLAGVNTYSGGTTIGGGTLELGGSGQLGGGAYAAGILNNGKLLYNSSVFQTLSGVVSGTGSVVKGLAATYSSIHHPSFLTTGAVTIFPNATLSDYFGADGIMGGSSVLSGAPFPADAYHFSNNGATATFQLQIYDGGHTKCVKVELTQVGPDIAGRVVYAKYLGSQNNLGFDFDTAGTPFGIATSYASGGYGAAEITLTTHHNSKLTLSAANTYSGGTVVNAGILEAATTASALPSSGAITVGSGGNLRLKVPGMAFDNPGGVGNGNPITVKAGGRLTLAAGFNAGYSRLITLDGGTLNSTALDGDNSNYLNDLALLNGAEVTGNAIRVGYHSAATITVAGTNASSLAAGMRLVNGGNRPLTLDVADVTGDPAADLTVSGVIWDFAGLAGMPIVKTGAGTVVFSSVNTYVGTTTITEGALALGTDAALDLDNNIVLNGGSLDMGAFNNVLGTLTVSANSQMALGSGQLRFDDSDAIAWTGSLALTGTLGPQTLRFGNSANALSSSQLQSISIDGHPVDIDQDGYLQKASQGTLFHFR